MRNKILLPIWCAGLLLVATFIRPVAVTQAILGGTAYMMEQHRAAQEAKMRKFFGFLGVLMFVCLSVSLINLIIHLYNRHKYGRKSQSSKLLLSYRRAGMIANFIPMAILIVFNVCILLPELPSTIDRINASGVILALDILLVSVILITLAIIAWLCWAIWRIHRWSEITTRRRRLVSISLATSIILSLLCLLWMLIIT